MAGRQQREDPTTVGVLPPLFTVCLLQEKKITPTWPDIRHTYSRDATQGLASPEQRPPDMSLTALSLYLIIRQQSDIYILIYY